ncbi:MAG: M20 family metallo-hydrolase [Anaerovoracaceae bacterium]|jgi:allantoate deiminase
MNVNGERLLSDLNQVKSFTDTPGKGVTRFSYSENDRKTREFITNEARAYGFNVRTDPIGNMYIGIANNNCKDKKICIGSHIDTVRNGGWLDGIYGVLSGLEILRRLAENKHKQLEGVELVVFAEEEGSNFGSTMTGSKFVSGIYGEKHLNNLKNDNGITLDNMLAQCDFPPYKESDVLWDFSNIKAMLELHIEQGPVLEGLGKTIGIVDTVFGMKTIEVTIEGIGNHAGATPMRYRKDPLVTVALCIEMVEKIAKADPEGVTVATVGKIAIYPNCSNVIADKVTFTVEVRDKKESRIATVMLQIEEAFKRISEERGTRLLIQEIAESRPTQMDKKIISIMKELAIKTGLPYEIMDSGAVHDTCILASHVPAGMLFVPSIGGRSHVPFEDTHKKDLVLGAQLLLDTVLAL